MQIAEAFITLRPDTKNFARDAEKQIGSPLKQVAAGAAAAFGAIAIGGFFRDAIRESREIAKVSRQTEAVLKSTGGVANVTRGQVLGLASSLEKLTAVEDDVIVGAENVLLTFTKVRNEVGKGNNIFDQAVKTALDMSAAFGGDLQSSVIQLGKALNDPLVGMTALQRVGVSFTAQQREQIKALTESGNLLQAQKVILGELRTQFGGAAEAAVDPLTRLQTGITGVKQSVGTALLPAIDLASGGLGKLADGFTALPGPIQTTISLLGTASVAVVGGQLAWTKLTAALEGTALANALANRSFISGGSITSALASNLSRISVVAGVATVGYRLLEDQTDLNTESFRNLRDAIAESSVNLEDGTRKAVASYIEQNNLTEAFAKANITVDEFIRLVKLGPAGLDELRRRLQDTGGVQSFRDGLKSGEISIDELQGKAADAGPTIDGLQIAFDEAGRAIAEGTRKAEASAKVLGNVDSSAAGAAKSIEDLAAAYDQQAAAAFDAHIGRLLSTLRADQQVTSAEEALAEAVHGTGDEAEQSTSKIKTYGDAVASVFDSIVNVERAHIAAREALARLTDVQTDQLTDARNRARGMVRLDGQEASSKDDVTGALLDVISAREQEIEQQAAAGEIANTSQARHQALVDSLLDLRNQYPELTGQIDRFIDAAKKIPELPLEATIDKVTGKQRDFRGATLDVVGALIAQAQADDDPIRGLQTMIGLTKDLIDQYSNFPAVRDIFLRALDEAIKTEAQLIGLAPEVLAALLNPESALAAISGMGFTYHPPGRASGGPVMAGMPYTVGERGPETFVPTTDGVIVPSGGTTLKLEQNFYGSMDPSQVGRTGSQGLRDAAFLLGVG